MFLLFILHSILCVQSLWLHCHSSLSCHSKVCGSAVVRHSCSLTCGKWRASLSFFRLVNRYFVLCFILSPSSFVLSPLATVIFSILLFSHLWQQSFSPFFCSLTFAGFGNSHFLHSFVCSPLATVIFSTLLFSHLWQQSFSPLLCSLTFGNSHFLHSFVLSPLATVIFSTPLFSHLWQQSFSPLLCSLTFGNSHFLHSFVLSPLATVIFSTLLFSHLWQQSFSPLFCSLTFGNSHFLHSFVLSPLATVISPPFCSLTFGNSHLLLLFIPSPLAADSHFLLSFLLTSGTTHFLVAVLTCGITGIVFPFLSFSHLWQVCQSSHCHSLTYYSHHDMVMQTLLRRPFYLDVLIFMFPARVLQK